MTRESRSGEDLASAKLAEEVDVTGAVDVDFEDLKSFLSSVEGSRRSAADVEQRELTRTHETRYDQANFPKHDIPIAQEPKSQNPKEPQPLE